MAIKITHTNTDHFYFVTFTCFNWLNLFQVTECHVDVYRWFEYLKCKKRIDVISYVIMPNHLHVILYLPEATLQLNKVIGNGKRFLAYAIIKKLELLQRDDILAVLYDSVTSRERRKAQKHRVFEKSFDAKTIYSEQFLFQKINYIHHNAVQGKWNLAEDYTLYPHSSAAFYESGRAYHFQPCHYDDVPE